MTELRGRIVDADTGRPLEARVRGRFADAGQRARMVELFGEGRRVYEGLGQT